LPKWWSRRARRRASHEGTIVPSKWLSVEGPNLYTSSTPTHANKSEHHECSQTQIRHFAGISEQPRTRTTLWI
jgi:hypothetical protein